MTNEGFSKAIARQLVREGVDCAICGHTEVTITAAEETGYVAAFLCSPPAVGITGEMIPVTGGAGRNGYC